MGEEEKKMLKKVGWAEYWRMVGNHKWKLVQIWTSVKPDQKTGPFTENLIVPLYIKRSDLQANSPKGE